MGASEPNTEISQALRQYYRSSEGYHQHLAGSAPEAYTDYLHFVETYGHPGDRILDLGCGTGYTTAALAKRGFRVYGLELSVLFLQSALKRPSVQEEHYAYICGDLLDLPVPDSFFDIVASRAVLEHISDPEEALSEMIRVVKPGGYVIVLGPNLLSPLGAVRAFWTSVARGERVLHPLFTSRWDALLGVIRLTWIITRKKVERNITFLTRDPTIIPETDQGLDLDAVYLLNPVDLCQYFSQRGFKIKSLTWPSSRAGKLFARVAPSYGGGVGFVAQKSNQYTT